MALLTTPKPLTVWITTNWEILQEMGIPDHLTCLLRNLYTGQEATVRTEHGTTDWFQIRKGVNQGCILSPCLFNLYAEFSSAQSFSHVRLFVIPWTAARQASLSITSFRSLHKLMSIESVMLSNHLILCRPLLLPPSVFPSIRAFSDESVLHIRWPKYSTSREMLGWMKHKLESRLPGEISITSDMQVIPPLWQKAKKIKEPQ